MENPLPSGSAAEQFLVFLLKLRGEEVSDGAVVHPGALHPRPAQLLRGGRDDVGVHPGYQEHLVGHLGWTSRQLQYQNIKNVITILSFYLLEALHHVGCDIVDVDAAHGRHLHHRRVQRWETCVHGLHLLQELRPLLHLLGILPHHLRLRLRLLADC